MMDTFRIKNYNPVNSTPVAADIGGKRNFTKKLSKLLRTFLMACRLNLFVGMGGIFFELKLILSPEISNNLLGYGVNFLGMFQHHYRPFMKNVSISDEQL
ncbi:DNA adenine methylase [Bartonella sp. CL435QHHD]|uniref:DNA adenine methylase n=1 Tax=Bartonella sp. CL435QHHD TaxID=3243530 RepID=UPI0035CFD779